MTQSLKFVVPGVGNLNDGIQEFEGILKRLRSTEEIDDRERKIQSIVVKIDKIKREKNKPFF